MTHKSAAETVAIEPHLVVMFGATGDLARRKLFPAIVRLLRRRAFRDRVTVLGVGRSGFDDESFRSMVKDALAAADLECDETAGWCASSLLYHRLDGDWDELARRVKAIEDDRDLPGNRVFYLAVPPTVFADTVTSLAVAGLHQGAGWSRVVVEKPFGEDAESGAALNWTLHEVFDEDQIFRIDHYLAKETVQNLLVFRFANPVFELAWNRDRIDRVQITVAETLGVERRGGYFDEAGMIRDVVQNHLLQVMALVAMEPPVRFGADEIRDEKVKVLRSIEPIQPDQAVLGQYEAGSVEGEQVPGYRDESGVAGDSTTETFAALRVDIDNWRWRGVPFYLRAGKRMPERLTQIAVRFREPPVRLFHDGDSDAAHGNMLFITLQPDEGFDMCFDVKTPGESMHLQTRTLSFRYGDVFGSLPDAYETLLADVLTGDQTLFVRADETEEAWRILAPLLDMGAPPESYEAGSWGPAGSAGLIEGAERSWTILSRRSGYSLDTPLGES
jgi:glucose-6-phosphate 1-dehydrogenase